VILLSGLKPDGSVKLRAVDNFTASGANPCIVTTEKLRCDTLDTYDKFLGVAVDKLGVRFFSWHVELVAVCVRLACTGKAGHVEGRHRCSFSKSSDCY